MAVMAVAQEKEISDMLTELYNKRYFETIMNTKVQRGECIRPDLSGSGLFQAGQRYIWSSGR